MKESITRAAALAALRKYNHEPFHIQHALTVEGVMRWYAQQLGYGDDPLNQRASVGWKGMRAAERLVEQYMIRIESVSSYSANAAAN